MAKVQNTFLKSKMSKDLDARILPNGEYRDARNIQVSRSEGSKVGALENVLGNKEILNFQTITGVAGLKCIGQLADEINNTVYLYLTTNVKDGYVPSASNFIISHNTLNSQTIILVKGAYLNFSTLNPIYGINILEGFLFWTDNRNQPRRIDTTVANPTGLANPIYYVNEDQISVAKYNPYQCIELYQFSNGAPDNAIPYETTMKDVTSKAFPNGGVGTVAGDGTTGTTTLNILAGNVEGDIVTGSPYGSGATIGYIASLSASIAMIETGGVNATVASSTYVVPTTPVGNPDPPYFTVVITGGNFPTIPVGSSYDIVFNPNPYYNPQFSGDPDYLEDRFVRFSYRFKFENNEYSIFAPFTQTAFIPKQDGYFMYLDEDGLPKVDDQTNTYRSTVASFVENKVDDIKLRIPIPFKNYNLVNNLKIKEIDILYRESDGASVKVVETLDSNFILNAAATCISSQVGGLATFAITGILGGIKVGDSVTGPGLGSGALTTYPAKVLSFAPTDPSNPVAGNITLDQNVTIQSGVTLTINDPDYLVYDYQSTKPFKTLPEFQTTRVYDKVPVRAFAQEISGNRVIYGNYQDKHTPPAAINYNVACTDKNQFSINEIGATASATYTNVNSNIILDITDAKDVSSVVAGMIFSSDSILVNIPEGTFISSVVAVPGGNQVTITLTNNVTIASGDIIILLPGGNVENSTSIIEYPNHSIKTNRNYQVGFVLSDRYGRQSSVILSNNTEELLAPGGGTYSGSTLYSPYISESTEQDIWPGNSLKVLVNNPITANQYNGDVTSTKYNPTGWYSYKVVVKQTEQEYYNVYLPGIMAAYPDKPTLELGNTSHAVLINDNINKVPRDLTEVGPQQRQFRSSVKLFGRVQNTSVPVTSSIFGNSNKQYYPGRNSDTVSTISTVNDLFDYDPISPNQPDYFPQFYNLNSNPLIARISTQTQIGQVATTNFSPSSATVEQAVDNFWKIPLTSITGEPEVSPNPDLVSGKGIPDNIYVNSFTAPIGSNGTAITNGAVGGSGNRDVVLSSGSITGGDPTPGSSVTGEGVPQYTIVDEYIIATNTLRCEQSILGVAEGTVLTFTQGPGEIEVKDATGALFRLSVDSGVSLTFTETIGGFPGVANVPGVQYLAVYETEPVESLLDIFWETSTAGLISELNDAILNASDAAATFSDFNTNAFTEGLVSGAAILQAPFQLTTTFGDVITGGTLVLNSVTEMLNGVPGADVQLTENGGPFFTLDGLVNYFWTIKTTPAYYSEIYYFNNEEAQRRQFRFNFTATVAGQDNVISQDANLENVEPVITQCPSATIYTNINASGPLLPQPVKGVNGANNVILRAFQCDFSIGYVRKGVDSAANDVTSDQFFLLSQIINVTDNTIEAQISINTQSPTEIEPDIYYISLDLIDGGDDATPCLIVIDMSFFIPPGNICNGNISGICQGDEEEGLVREAVTIITIDSNVTGADPATQYGVYVYTGGFFTDYSALPDCSGYFGLGTPLDEYSGGSNAVITIPRTIADGAGNVCVTAAGVPDTCPVWFFAPTLNLVEALIIDSYQCNCTYGNTGSLSCGTGSGCSYPTTPETSSSVFQIT